MAPVGENKAEALRALLSTMVGEPGQADPNNTLIPFGAFDRLHFARLFLVEVNTWRDIRAHGVQPRPYPPHLVFLGDIDGDRTSFLAELATRARDGLRQIFSHCSGFSPTGDELLTWMQARNVQEAANYVNTRGRTVRQIREEAALRRSLSARLPLLVRTLGSSDAGVLYAALQSFAWEERRAGRLFLTPQTPTPLRRRVRDLAGTLGVPLALLLAAPALALAAPFLILQLRRLERSDPEVLPRPDDTHVAYVSTMEDYDVTNAFSAAGDLKPGLFRRYAATLLLFLLDYATHHIYARGHLARVQTIHFARWVFFDDRRRILFCSNYDGSLESYMDDFINKVAWGLNLVFSNGVGYPSTRFLIKDGARQETKFKRFLRNRQLPTDVWYKAYPGLTAHDLSENSFIRRGLESRLDGERAIRRWLAAL